MQVSQASFLQSRHISVAVLPRCSVQLSARPPRPAPTSFSSGSLTSVSMLTRAWSREARERVCTRWQSVHMASMHVRHQAVASTSTCSCLQMSQARSACRASITRVSCGTRGQSAYESAVGHGDSQLTSQLWDRWTVSVSVSLRVSYGTGGQSACLSAYESTVRQVDSQQMVNLRVSSVGRVDSQLWDRKTVDGQLCDRWTVSRQSAVGQVDNQRVIQHTSRSAVGQADSQQTAWEMWTLSSGTGGQLSCQSAYRQHVSQLNRPVCELPEQVGN